MLQFDTPRLLVLLLMLVLGGSLCTAQKVFVVDSPADWADWKHHPGPNGDDGICFVCLQTDLDGNCVQADGCTLRAAIQQANKDGIPTVIRFTVPFIAPLDPLPRIRVPVIIDGDLGNNERVHISGAMMKDRAVTGLWFEGKESEGCIVRNIEISDFTFHALYFNGSGDHTIQNCYIHDNEGDGIRFISEGEVVAGNLVGGLTDIPGNDPGNIICGNGTGVTFDRGYQNTMQGNLVGLDVSRAAAPNGSGVVIREKAAALTIVGGSSRGARNVISANRSVGISATAASGGASGVHITNNYIGTDTSGTMRMGNSTGVRLYGDNHIIGGVLTEEGNVISGNSERGISIESGAQIRINHNLIGVTATGVDSLGNGQDGITVSTLTDQVSIRFNTISGNGSVGIRISGDAVHIDGNSIGTDRLGNTAFPNGGHGVLVASGTSHCIGVSEGNLISGNKGSGIRVQSSGTRISGNTIGTDRKGERPMGNLHGIHVSRLVAGDTIGGLNSGQGNLISGNRAIGIFLEGWPGPQWMIRRNLIAGNIIGLSANGLDPVPNDSSGICLVHADSNTIGGNLPGYANFISGNGKHGIDLRGGCFDNNIVGNLVGTDREGERAIGNLEAGIFINGAEQNVIESWNVISGNRGDGVFITDPNSRRNSIQGNIIGLNRRASKAIGNGGSGIHIREATHTRIGGLNPDHRNIVSGNHLDGIRIEDGMGNMQTSIVGNFIGTDSTGFRAAGNAKHGIRLSLADGIIIGESDDRGGNCISGNDSCGIVVTSSIARSENVTIRYNRIGVTRDGSDPLGNGAPGILLHHVQKSSIGGPLTGNVIGSNGASGILGIDCKNITILGNTIGVDTGRTRPLGNKGHGILLHESEQVLVGDPGDPRAANVIAFNDSSGVAITGGDSKGNTLRGNLIKGNGLLGIDLGADGPTPNDLGRSHTDVDSDEGPNYLVNFPVGVTFGPEPNSSRTIISGLVDTQNPKRTIVDIFALSASDVDPSRFGEGGRLLASVVPFEDGMFIVTIDETLEPNTFLSALLTQEDGSTSEFSQVCGDPLRGSVDLDGDGLCDNWEREGLDYDGDGSADLPLHEAPFEAKYDRKDLFVEIDWMSGMIDHAIEQAAIDRIRDVFANAPVSNPDGSTGITAHLMPDEAVPFIERIWFSNSDDNGVPLGPEDSRFDDLKLGKPINPCGTGATDAHFGTTRDRASGDSCMKIIGARRLAFRYALLANESRVKRFQAKEAGPSGQGEIGGNDYMLSLGGKSSQDYRQMAGGIRSASRAKAEVEAGTFLHELGHTLNLRHGGSDNINFKPNYLSVMSYTRQWQEILPGRSLDYSRAALASLDESNLDESVGLDGPSGEHTAFTRQPGFQDTIIVVPVDIRPIDWDGTDSDGDGDPANDKGIRQDLNHFDPQEARQMEVLTGHDDWFKVRLNFRLVIDFADGKRTTPPNDEKTFQQGLRDAMRVDADGDGIPNAIDNCPNFPNPNQTDRDGDGIGDDCESSSQSDLSIVPVRVLDSIAAGQDYSFILIARNNGPDHSKDVEIAISKPTNALITELDNGLKNIRLFEEGYFCSSALLNRGDSIVFQITIRPTGTDTVSFTARLSADGIDPDTSNNVLVVNMRPVITTEQPTHNIPTVFQVHWNFPNPFGQDTNVPVEISKAGTVRLFLYDALGRVAAILTRTFDSPGRHIFRIQGTSLQPGVYYYVITSDGSVKTGKIVRRHD